MFCVGLTGATGSGKSTAAALFRELGVTVIDADKVAHELYVPGGELLRRLDREFGPGIVDAEGALDRGALAKKVFGNPDRLEKLGGIVHPHLLRELEARLRALTEKGESLVLVEAALLLRWGPPDFIDLVVGVVAGRELRRKRLVAGGLSEDQVEARLDMQVEEDELLHGSDILLGNDGDPAALRAGVKGLHAELRRRAESRTDETDTRKRD